MKPFSENRRSEGCLSDYALDALRLGELSAAETSAHEAHLAGCDVCSKRLEAFRAEAASFDVLLERTKRESATRDVVVPVRKNAALRALYAGGGLLALAAGVALFFRARVVETTVDGPDEVRLKGKGAQVVLFIEENGRVRHGYSGDTVHPQDKLQFAVATKKKTYVAVVSIDGAREKNVYYAGNDAVEPNGSPEVPLSSSILLDKVLGEETLWGITCAAAQSEEGLRKRLSPAERTFALPDGCKETKWVLSKVARSQ